MGEYKVQDIIDQVKRKERDVEVQKHRRNVSEKGIDM